ncbi:MAG TPA: non-homologous end-joining DNA ligase [Methylomirabilota bacterium]|nr:non-homologous end-joining DNA ligase [Methylomirabilota bacterium]
MSPERRRSPSRRAAPAAAGGAAVRVAGVTVTHPDKVWWPEERITKLEVVRFYAAIASRLLPWIDDRPLAAERCPEGMRGECFFQKNFADGLPAGVRTAPLAAASAGRTVNYVVGGSIKTLLALVNLGCIAVHVMNCRTGSRERPDWIAFDLDPGSGRFADAAKAGRLLREIIEEHGLSSYPKTSGGRGLHVLVPLRRGPTQDAVRAFAQAVGRSLAERAPELVTVEMSKAKRRGRVFADALRNAFGQTIVAPYSVRRRPKAPVSTPLAWDEVDPRLDPARYNIRTFESRLAGPDPWADLWKHRQALPELRADTRRR